MHEGYLEPIGEATDPKVIALKIAALHGQYRIQALAYDRWRIGDLKRELDAIGCPVQLVPHGQGFRDMCRRSTFWSGSLSKNAFATAITPFLQ